MKKLEFNENGSPHWFAFQKDAEDTDCGTGTYYREEAIEWLENQIKAGNTKARICVCSEESDDCEELITSEDL